MGKISTDTTYDSCALDIIARIAMIHIASTYVADVLNDSLKSILQQFCEQELVFHYNQLFQQAIFPNSEFNENKNGLNVILVRFADLFNPNQETSQSLQDLISAITSLQHSMQVPLLIVVTPSRATTDAESNYYLNLENNLKQAIGAHGNTIFVSANTNPATQNEHSIFDPFTEKHGHIPYTIEFYESLALLIARNYSLLTRKPYKVIVLDCDGTLWQGIIEEDGCDGIVIGAEYRAFQQFMISLFHAGFLLCLCSKNSEKSVLDVIKRHKEMLIDLDKHICSYRINWLPKSVNIQSLADELNLGLDSFIFIDDNNIECAEVKAALPEVLVIELPTIPRLDYLKNIWAFDIRHISREDEKRTELYKQNKLRETLKTESMSYEEFLKNLEIKIAINDANFQDLDRIIQLSQRTNQFNLLPSAVSSMEFNERILSRQSSGCLTIKVSDKYGDYGLVGVVVFDRAADELIIKSLFLSCRILGRGVEYAVIQHLVNTAERDAAERIKILFTVTEKNMPAVAFIKHLSNQEALEHVDHLLLPIETLKNLTPKLTPHAEKKNKSNPVHSHVANDFMLAIAKSSLPEIKHTKAPHYELESVEKSLVELFKQNQLWNEKPGTPFIDLGITSLQCVLLASTIYQRFHVEIIPFALLEPTYTLSKLTHFIVEHLKANNLVPELQHDAPVVTLSTTQLRLWEDEQIFPDTYRNTMFVAYELDELINKEIMETVLMQLMARHDALRFTFFAEHEKPFLKLNPLQSIACKMDYFISNDDTLIENYVTEFKHKPFDLSQAPLFRAALIRKENNTSLFLFSIHHIIHDGWSLNIFLRELSDLYSACAQHITLPEAVKAGQYLNFIRWQQEMIGEEVLAKQRAFWKKNLAHIPKLELIYDKTMKEQQKTPLSHRLTFKINATITRKLKKIAINNHVTLYDVLLSAFGLFLSHFTNQNDINFITAVSGRHHTSVAEVIGFFTNLVLIRMHLNTQETFSDLIIKNQKMMQNIFNNQDVPFNEIIQLTGESISSKIHAFNQVGFIFQSYPINHLVINDKVGKRAYADDKAELVYDACNECRFGNLVFFMQEYNANLHGMVEYNTILFEKQRMQCMMESFKTFLKYTVELQDKPALSIPLVSTKQAQIFQQWNQPQINYPKHVSLLSYFYQHVLAHRDAVAVEHNDDQMTYGELDQLTNQLARKLQKEGVGHEMPVGIFLEKNYTRIVAILSIIKAGGCYVPLEIDLPIERIRYIIRDSGISLIITSDATDFYLKEHCSALKTSLVTDQRIASESNLPLPDRTHPQQLAYILYTSGSTGNPKGVAIEQTGILRLVKGANYININTKDRIAQVSNFVFDAATFEIWGALLNGAKLVLIDKKVLLDAVLLNAVLQEKKISIIFFTTQLYHAYMQLAPHMLQNLNYLLVGGEAMLPETVERLFAQKNHPRHFMNVYGPTENTTFSTSYLIKKNCNLDKPIPIGKPISGTQVYVLDECLNPVPVGAPGTLYVGGVGLARGYINQEQLNSDKFIYHAGERLYNTGDLVIWQPDGNLRFLGRKDNQVKINGYRIELDEISLQLETHHLVRQAIVLVKTKNHHKQLVSYILLEPGNDLHEVNLYHYLKTTLPHYMVPKFYYQIDSMPVTENGKVDKKLLLKSEFPAVSYTQYEPATNILQENLISCYAEILHIPPTEISINAEFFDLGGTSITALHLIDQVNEQFKVSINFSTLYEHASVKALSEQINILTSQDAVAPANILKANDKAIKTIHVGDSQKTPLIFIHPIGGTGFCYLDLIKLLPSNQPCYIIQDPSIDANQVLFADIPTMAECYNELLLKQFACKKIILSGYSFGGMLSLEMASQLEHQELDNTLDSVITFDTWVVSDFMNVAAKEALKLSIMRQYERVATNLTNQHIDPKPWMELYYRRLQDLGFAYKPPKINKKIILFKADQQLGEFSAMSDETNYLSNHTSEGVEVHKVPGNHDTILKYPNVRGIGRLLNNYLKGKTC